MSTSTPDVPDASTTANTQAQYNSSTALQQQAMNMINQSTPYGSLTYNQTGTTTITGPNGQQIQVPQYTATTSLSPSQQAIFDKTQSAESNIADLANNQSKNLSSILSTPFSYDPSNDATNWAYKLGSSTILPQQQEDTAALQRQLLQRGLRPGDPQYESSMRQLQQSQSNQLNSLALSGESQAFNEAAYQRSEPLNELTALLSGSQVTSPTSTFASTPTTSVAGTDYTSDVNNAYNQEVSQSNAAMGGLFGLGGTLGGGLLQGIGKAGSISAFFSDRRLKSDIKYLGKTRHNLNLYEYEIFGRRENGVMADEVERVVPEAVINHSSGYKMVDYGMLGIAHG